MLAKVQHLGITTPIVGMDGLCLNHRCAVWLNGEAARQIKNDAIEAKAKASSDKADKLRVQAVNKAARLVVQNAKSARALEARQFAAASTDVSTLDPEPTELFLPSVNSYCEHFSCANEYRIGIPGQPS